MKIECKEFDLWLKEYEPKANYFVAQVQNDKDQNHALYLCMRDAFVAGMLDTGSEPVEK
jgi:hypothetical protein